MFSVTPGRTESISESVRTTPQLVPVFQQPRSISRQETDEALEMFCVIYIMVLFSSINLAVIKHGLLLRNH